jgi:2-keto-4-pentenoate hydratase
MPNAGERESVQASIARAFVEARRTGAVIAAYPGEMPGGLDAAYDIQDAGIAMVGNEVGGWKVGRIAQAFTETFGTNRLAGPIFANRIVDTNDPEVPLLKGFAAIEAELLLRVGRTPPSDIRIDQARDYIDSVRFGLEVASSPFPGINDHGPAVTITDFGNNFGLVLGPQIEDWQTRDLLNAPVTLAIDGAQVGEAHLAQMLDGPFGAFCFLAHSLAQRGLALEPGQWISTGAITGVHPILPGQEARATFDRSFMVSCRTASYRADNGVNRSQS